MTSFEALYRQFASDVHRFALYLTGKNAINLTKDSPADDTEPGIYLLDTRTGKVREILSVAPNGVYTVVVSRDGRRIYFGLGVNEADVWLMSRE